MNAGCVVTQYPGPGNKFGVDGAQALSSALTGVPRLTTLYMDSTKLGILVCCVCWMQYLHAYVCMFAYGNPRMTDCLCTLNNARYSFCTA